VLAAENPPVAVVVDRLRPRSSAPAPADSASSTASTDPKAKSAASSPGFVPISQHLKNLNGFLKNIGCQEINSIKLKYEATYGSQKLKEITDATQNILQIIAGRTVKLPVSEEFQEFEGLVESLKKKFGEAKTISEQVLVLSALPPGWTRTKILEIFGPLGATNYMIRKVKKLVNTNGPLCNPDPCPGRPLSEDTVKIIKDFYERDETSSKQMPGCKDYVSVMENGVKVQKQKRMILSNLKHLHEEYMQEYGKTHPEGFSKFAALRPKHCVLDGAAGTHTFCVCVYHENTNLMFEGARLKAASADDAQPLVTFKDCFKYLMCEIPTSECYLRQCRSCPSPDALQERIRSLFEQTMVESITFRRWSKIDKRYTLEKVTKPAAEFTEDFIETLIKLLPHHFYTKNQAAFYQDTKKNLKVGEALVISDFAENYSCIM